MSKLTLTSEQRGDALKTVAWIRAGAPLSMVLGFPPPFAERTPGYNSFMSLQQWASDLEEALAEHTKPTIKLRIRVGVTADGKWIGTGSSLRSFGASDVERAITSTHREHDHGPVVAWHWITAEVPMPETERGDVAGEVER